MTPFPRVFWGLEIWRAFTLVVLQEGYENLTLGKDQREPKQM